MLGYYINLALRSLRQNGVLTVLMITAIGVGIGASMTTLSIFRAMSSNPIRDKSSRLFTPQIDNYGPGGEGAVTEPTSDHLPMELTYTDSVALMRAHRARHQVAMYATVVAVTPPDPRQLPIQVPTRATYADFFTMFDVPFEYGAPWSALDDDGAAPVIVLARDLNDRLFGGANSVGRTLRLNDQEYRITGVIEDWNPMPRFYDLYSGKFGGPEEIFMPFTRAVAQRLPSAGMTQCLKNPGTGPDVLLHSECVWTQLWVELPNDAAVRAYRSYLAGYVAEQRRVGRFGWPARSALRDVSQWLGYNRIVSSEVSVLLLVSLAFLLVCLLNAVGLMLAKFMARAPHVCTRRALGADRQAVFGQCLVEAGVVGILGGLVGVGLMMLGLHVAAGLFSGAAVALTRPDGGDVAIALALSVGATLLAAMYPTWRASHVQPAWHLKVQ